MKLWAMANLSVKKLKKASTAMFSGMLVYVIMAACSAESGKISPRQAADASPGSGGTTWTGGTAPDNNDASLLDRMFNPVPDAKGQTSGSRLKARYIVGADGSKQFSGWRDMQRNEDCSFTIASDGTLRCLPSLATAGSYFSDAGCTAPLATVSFGTCSAPTPAYVGVLAGCSLSVRMIGAQYTGATYAGSPASCVATMIPAGYRLYAAGADVSATAFVQGTYVTD